MKVRITQIDGRLPNLALMRISAFHRAAGDEVVFRRTVRPDLLEPDYDRVYGSTIFKFSDKPLNRFLDAFPDAIMGGTGSGSILTVESLGLDAGTLDYSIYPDFNASLGFTQRGCRLSCKFCVVPEKEGKNHGVKTVYDVWRGDPYPRHLHLLDNDFFGQDDWRQRAKEIIDGGFRVCFNQGINTRLIDDEAAATLAKMQYYDDQFKVRRLYTAWDNAKDFKIFMRGVDTLKRHGVPPEHLLAYMLVGYAKNETMEEIEWRFWEMTKLGIYAYPMVYDRSRPELRAFARWAIRSIWRSCPKFSDYHVGVKKRVGGGDLFAEELV